MNRISIILPVRPNCGTLASTINSIKQQTHSDWEVIALLDRDNGDSEKILKAEILQERLTVIKVNYQSMGFPAILNVGIANAKFDLLARFDDDDTSTKERLQLQAEILERQPEIGLVTGWAEVVSSTGESLYWIKPGENSIDIEMELLKVNVIPHSSVMFRKSVVEAVGGYRNGLVGCEDYDLWLRLIGHSNFFGIQKKILTYLQNPLGMTKSPIPNESIHLLRESRTSAQKKLNQNFLKSLLQTKIWEKSQ